MADPGYLYILRSTSGHLYTGSCLDPNRRLGEHSGGHVSATRGKGPWQRVALLQFASATLSRQAESWIKKLRRREYTEMIIAGSFEWPARFGPVTQMEPVSPQAATVRN